MLAHLHHFHHHHHKFAITFVILLVVAAFREEKNVFVFGGAFGGGRQFVSTRFIRNSPVGIGIACALKKNTSTNSSSSSSSSRTRSRSCSRRGNRAGSINTNTYVSSLFADTNYKYENSSEEESCLSQHLIRNTAIQGTSETDDLRQIEIPTIKVKSKQIPQKQQKWGLPSLSNNIDYENNNNNDEELYHLEKQNKMLARPCAATTQTKAVDATRHMSGTTTITRGGTAPASLVAAGTAAAATRSLMFWENMLGGAISRSVAQTVMHPANTMKTILQSSRGPDRITISQLLQPSMFKLLTRGAGANFILSVPHGAVNFAVLEMVRAKLNDFVSNVPYLSSKLDSLGPALDFTSSAVSTICCSIVSTPQMMITDNIMAGNYPNLMDAITGLSTDRGIAGFYAGWWPGLVGKIPSYALTWTFFQQLKRIRDNMMSDRPARNIENTAMGCIASATTVCIMIPLDTIKTRLVTQMSAASVAGTVPYKGILDCAVRMAQEEGIASFYRGLAPRLVSVVPMIGIQFGVYEFMKKLMLQRPIIEKPLAAASVVKAGVASKKAKKDTDPLSGYGAEEALEEAAMETAASGSDPFPAPHFHEKKK